MYKTVVLFNSPSDASKWIEKLRSHHKIWANSEMGGGHKPTCVPTFEIGKGAHAQAAPFSWEIVKC